MTASRLSSLVGVSPATISRFESGNSEIPEDVVSLLSAFLDFPTDFFYLDDPVSLGYASFRSAARTSAKAKKKALVAGSFGVDFARMADRDFRLPEPRLPTVDDGPTPSDAAKEVRSLWGIGVRPVGDLLSLLEDNGVRVFSLAEDGPDVDAFSFWHCGTPFVFLNTFKSAERTRFDAAHELGHLVLHSFLREDGLFPAGTNPRELEDQANEFASNFLMPEEDVYAEAVSVRNHVEIVERKVRWGVSAVALAYRLRSIGILSDWQYKHNMIEMGRRGYRTEEPNPILRETSQVWEYVLAEYGREGLSFDQLARKLAISTRDFQSLFKDLV